MAKIRDSNPGESSGGYLRLFGMPELGRLISRLQSTVISSGTELERMIIARLQPIDDLDQFLKADIMPDGVFVAPKKQVKKCKTLQSHSGEPDFLIFKRRSGKQTCYVVELKDGHVFDTKKASAERRAIHAFMERNGQHLPYVIQCYFCAFNQDDPEEIRKGFKHKIELSEAITGRGFCELLEIDYDEIVEQRRSDQPDNFNFFLTELIAIDEVKNALLKLLGKDSG